MSYFEQYQALDISMSQGLVKREMKLLTPKFDPNI